MFTESDARERLPKAIACANRIREINSDIVVEPDETVLLNLTAPVNATLARPVATLTIVNDD